ncbi:hypothetical protein Pst134EA_025544 [Puccinia striiformis f. sp. tritici]|uniref:Uncharacterized protein n=1 Tax=Puccinia striiformis f. sp. tritici PST-78 TaxID=1165861 RepID=A0A0L0V4Y2_9BASI|nr:hypothetical protein Pst134EA_025544 [Puccinia striiformis f. sp. tritici]KAH9451597.1 hypothetical protein Pst134EA_025544 [Puccinia striiformis f. sp. tritici]KAI9627284.1 hypothetical protein KEM48_009909 [Puccinia striiformis f. sp. tritici PST-130]KNE94024.1 hypothetical protein PSTG_12600 [Puccinia striiformis f. sp. tritici PST-78]
MDESNPTRFRSALNDLDIPLTRHSIHPTKGELAVNPNAHPCATGQLIPKITKRPAHLWSIIKDYHQLDNEASLYLIPLNLNQLQQDYKTSITANIDASTTLKNEFINQGGYVNKSQLGQILLHSLNDSHLPEVQYISSHIKPINSQSVINALKSYEENNQNLKISSKSKITSIVNNLQLAGNTFKSNTPKPKCIQFRTATRQMHCVFMACGSKVNLVHPKFEAMWNTGAFSHMFNDYVFFKNTNNSYQSHSPIMTAQSEELIVEAKGEVVVEGLTIKTITLQDSRTIHE